MSTTERAIAWIFCIAILWAVLAVLRWFFGAVFSMFSRPEPLQPEDEWAHVNETIKQPRQRPDGSWEKAEITWRTVDAPPQPQWPDVHDTTNPNHNPRACAICNERPGYSGVSFRRSVN